MYLLTSLLVKPEYMQNELKNSNAVDISGGISDFSMQLWKSQILELNIQEMRHTKHNWIVPGGEG